MIGENDSVEFSTKGRMAHSFMQVGTDGGSDTYRCPRMDILRL